MARLRGGVGYWDENVPHIKHRDMYGWFAWHYSMGGNEAGGREREPREVHKEKNGHGTISQVRK